MNHLASAGALDRIRDGLRGSPLVSAMAFLAVAGAAFVFLGLNLAPEGLVVLPVAAIVVLWVLSRRNARSKLRILVVQIVLVTVLLEAVLAASRFAPTLARVGAVRRVAAQCYQADRRIIQFLPDCARYDPGLGYTLKPGECLFENTEFSVRFLVNQAGLRDDPGSLERPGVIVLGDSHAMGWGVEQAESFPEILERTLGEPVLNAAISSYGTVREMKMLRRIDTSRLRTLVVQYCVNDRRENRSFHEAGNTLPILSAEEYEESVDEHRRMRRYYFPRYLRTIVRDVRMKLSKAVAGAARSSGPTDADLFLNALLHGGVDLSDVHVIVLEMNGRDWPDTGFLQRLRRRLAEGGVPGAIGDVTLLDPREFLVGDDYFLLDEHMNASGHRKLARRILDVLERHDPGPPADPVR